MSRLFNSFFVPLILIFVGAWLVIGSAACSATTQSSLAQIPNVITTEVDEALADPNELVFAGQVEDENGRWLNNCVVILFRNGEEAARTITGLKESVFSDDGPMDGVFELRVTNIYKLAETHEFYFYPSREDAPMRTIPGVVGNRYLGLWLEDLNPSDMRQVNVPAKQLEYALVVLPMSQDELPDNYQEGNLSFKDGLLVIKSEEAEAETVPETAVPPAPPETNVQFGVLANEGQQWRLQMTGYYGNRWDVWEKYVAGRGSGMNWETFKEAVLVYNPHLETDGFVFYPEKSYLLPFAP